MKRFVLNVAGLFIAIVAVLFDIHSLYLMAAILWLIPAISYLMGWLMLGGLTCERALPLSASAGEAVTLALPAGQHEPAAQVLPAGAGRPAARGPARRWPAPARPGPVARRGGDHRPAGSRRGGRGVFSVGPAQIYSTDPLGLQTFVQRLPQVSELTVYPALLPIQQSWLRGAAAQGWRGTASALTRGAGDDFYGVREYGPGDELRRVHWRTTARTGTLAVTEYAQGVTHGRDTGPGPVARGLCRDRRGRGRCPGKRRHADRHAG